MFTQEHVDQLLEIARVTNNLGVALVNDRSVPHVGFVPGEGPCPLAAMVAMGIPAATARAALAAASGRPWRDDGATGVKRALVMMPRHVVSFTSDAGYGGAFDVDREIFRTPVAAVVLDA